jgi:hypothetical protein
MRQLKMSDETDSTGFISVARTDWHFEPAKPGDTQPNLYWTYGTGGIGYLTSDGDARWAYARPDWNAAIRININFVPGGMTLQDMATGALLTRSGDWVKWAHGGSHDDTLVQWQTNESNGTYWLRFKSGGSWLCTDKHGELNVKNQGEWAQFKHLSMAFRH